VFDATLSLYGRAGWLGFNLDAVSREAKVSKDALYRRWKSREALLESALRCRWNWVADIDTGDIRQDFLALASRTFETFAGTYGEVALQLRADARRFHEVRAFAEPYRALMVREGRGIVSRAIVRGDLPPAAKPGLIVDLLIGGVINHVVSTPSDLRERVFEESDDFVRKIVEIILQGVRITLAG